LRFTETPCKLRSRIVGALSSPPTKFADFLQLTLEETEQLVADFCTRTGVQLPAELAKLLHQFTSGHIGMTRAALEAIHQRFKRIAPMQDIAIGEVINFLLSAEMLHNIHVGIRSPAEFHHFSDASKRMLTQIMREGYVTVDASSPELDVAHDLMERNIVRWSEEINNQVLHKRGHSTSGIRRTVLFCSSSHRSDHAP
jgi:hypothetical protein